MQVNPEGLKFVLPSGVHMCQMVERGPVLSVPSTMSECFTPQMTG
jgi:hypothetical protein